jgi:hypothetical protein
MLCKTYQDTIVLNVKVIDKNENVLRACTCSLQVESLVQQLNRSKDDKAKEMDEMSKLLQMHTAHINKLQNHLGTSKLDCTAHDTRHLTIGMGEGLFEIHVDHLQLSPEALGSLVAQVRETFWSCS